MSGNVVVLEPAGDQFERGLFSGYDITGSAARSRFREFFRNFRQGNVYIYRDALVRHWDRKEFYIEVELGHVNEYDEVLLQSLQTRPTEILPFFEAGAKDALKLFLTLNSANEVNQSTIPDFQIILKSNENTQSLRNLTAEHVNRMIKVPGIVISCSRLQVKATVIVLRCTKCTFIKRVLCKAAFAGAALPRECEASTQEAPCGPSPYIGKG
jgi:DNA replication licensing factor MCM5